jgi:hypothetical protein
MTLEQRVETSQVKRGELRKKKQMEEAPLKFITIQAQNKKSYS